MSPTSDGSKSSGALQTILVGIILALVVGGSSPWWWDKIFGGNQVSSGTPDRPVHSPTSYMGPLEGGTNRQGNDLSSVGIQNNSAAECSDLCGSDPNCKAMTFVKHTDANGGICWPKGSVASPIPNPAMVSAVKLYPETTK